MLGGERREREGEREKERLSIVGLRHPRLPGKRSTVLHSGLRPSGNFEMEYHGDDRVKPQAPV
jgi:hypothetical protein